MSNYREEQEWFLRDLEEQQHYLENKDIEDTIAGIDRKLRGRIVKYMRTSKVFARVSAKECFERWKAGYRAQKPSALKILKDLREDDDLVL